MNDDKIRISPDALIAMIVTEAQDRELARMPSLEEMNEDFQPSEKFQRKMEALVRDTKRKAEREKRLLNVKRFFITLTAAISIFSCTMLPVKAVREAVGSECDIMIETHAMLNYRVAVKMAERLAKLDITWYEEPAGPESSQTLRAMRERIPSDVAICVGERHYTRFGIRSLLEKHVCDVIMPDITRCGGPSEMKRMATMAEAYNVLIAPHNPNGPLSTLASSHVCAAIPNFFRQEFMFNDVPWRDTVIDHPIAEMVYDGHLHLSDRPGLGVDLVEEEMEKHPGITTDAPDNFYI